MVLTKTCIVFSGPSYVNAPQITEGEMEGIFCEHAVSTDAKRKCQ